MIDYVAPYIPPDIPPAVVKFVETKFPDKPCDACIRRWYMYLTNWNNYELYATDWSRSELRKLGFPMLIVYDCHEARIPTRDEVIATRPLMVKYFSGYARSEHLCHRNKRAYNQHTRPEDYNKKVKHITPKYIPEAVVNYVDKRNDSFYPGTTRRFIKYLTTYDNQEVYLYYWTEPFFSNHRSGYRPIFYDCEKVRVPSLEEYYLLKKKEPSVFDVFSRPSLCKKR